MEDKNPVFKSDEIAKTKAHEKQTPEMNTRKNNPSEQFASARKKIEKLPAIIAKNKKIIILSVTIFAVLLLGYILIPKIINAINKNREISSASSETEAYINYINKKESMLESYSGDEPEETENPAKKILSLLDTDEIKNNESKRLDLLLSLTKIYNQTKEYTAIETILEKYQDSFKNKQNKAIVYARIAEAYYSDNNEEQAFSYLEKALSLTSDPDSLDSYTGAYMDLIKNYKKRNQ